MTQAAASSSQGLSIAENSAAYVRVKIYEADMHEAMNNVRLNGGTQMPNRLLLPSTGDIQFPYESTLRYFEPKIQIMDKGANNF